MSTTKSDEYVPKVLRDIQKHIRSINGILSRFKKCFIKRNDNLNTWPEYNRKDLISIMTNMNIDDSSWINIFETSVTPSLIYRTIKKLLDLLLSRHQLEHKLMTDKRIEQFIQSRYLNYTDNLKKFIDFLLKRNKRYIVLDKVIYKDTDGQEQVTVNPDKIKQLTNDHFQNVAKSKNCSKEFSPE